MSCQDACSCLSVEKVKVHSLGYLGGYSAQQCSIFLFFPLYLTLLPLTQNKANFTCFWDCITPGLPEWQTLFSLGRGGIWFPQIVDGTQKLGNLKASFTLQFFLPKQHFESIFSGRSNMLSCSQKRYQRLFGQKRPFHFRMKMLVLSCLEGFLFPQDFQLSLSWNAVESAQILSKAWRKMSLGTCNPQVKDAEP